MIDQESGEQWPFNEKTRTNNGDCPDRGILGFNGIKEGAGLELKVGLEAGPKLARWHEVVGRLERSESGGRC